MIKIKDVKFDYKDQLLTDEWKVKREEVLKADNYTCQICFKKDKSLEVHHKKYKFGHMAWQYETRELITLCHDCHELYHKELNIFKFCKTIFSIFPSYGSSIKK